MRKEMPVYAKKLSKEDRKRFETNINEFVHNGNYEPDYYPSDVDDDEGVIENAEEEEVLDDAMGDDDLELLKSSISLPQS